MSRLVNERFRNHFKRGFRDSRVKAAYADMKGKLLSQVTQRGSHKGSMTTVMPGFPYRAGWKLRRAMNPFIGTDVAAGFEVGRRKNFRRAEDFVHTYDKGTENEHKANIMRFKPTSKKGYQHDFYLEGKPAIRVGYMFGRHPIKIVAGTAGAVAASAALMGPNGLLNRPRERKENELPLPAQWELWEQRHNASVRRERKLEPENEMYYSSRNGDMCKGRKKIRASLQYGPRPGGIGGKSGGYTLNADQYGQGQLPDLNAEDYEAEFKRVYKKMTEPEKDALKNILKSLAGDELAKADLVQMALHQDPIAMLILGALVAVKMREMKRDQESLATEGDAKIPYLKYPGRYKNRILATPGYMTLGDKDAVADQINMSSRNEDLRKAFKNRDLYRKLLDGQTERYGRVRYLLDRHWDKVRQLRERFGVNSGRAYHTGKRAEKIAFNQRIVDARRMTDREKIRRGLESVGGVNNPTYKQYVDSLKSKRPSGKFLGVPQRMMHLMNSSKNGNLRKADQINMSSRNSDLNKGAVVYVNRRIGRKYLTREQIHKLPGKIRARHLLQIGNQRFMSQFPRDIESLRESIKDGAKQPLLSARMSQNNLKNDKWIGRIRQRQKLFGINNQFKKVKGGIHTKEHFTSRDAIPQQLKMGIKTEREHTSDPKKAKKIALDHLAEHSHYYSGLKRMESKLGKRLMRKGALRNWLPAFGHASAGHTSGMRYPKSGEYRDVSGLGKPKTWGQHFDRAETKAKMKMHAGQPIYGPDAKQYKQAIKSGKKAGWAVHSLNAGFEGGKRRLVHNKFLYRAGQRIKQTPIVSTAYRAGRWALKDPVNAGFVGMAGLGAYHILRSRKEQ